MGSSISDSHDEPTQRTGSLVDDHAPPGLVDDHAPPGLVDDHAPPGLVDEVSVPPHARRGRSIGRYLVIDPLGAGGMGEVFSAYDPELDRRVALKLLRVGSGRHGVRAQARLLREAQALAKLSHPNVVAVFDAGTHAGRVFIAMEYVEGITLREWLEAEERPWPAVLAVLIDAGRGLAAAHEQGLVHRDFKPSNVMVGRERNKVCVLDFGLARSFDDAPESSDGSAPPDVVHSGEPLSASLTETGVVMGTPKFMAPEQFVAGSIDARSDQFAFCVVAWLALYRTAPFRGETFAELQLSVRAGAIVAAPRDSNVPRVVRLALEHGLDVDPQRRFADMHALLAELESALGASRRRKLTIVGAATVLVLGAGAVAITTHAGATCGGMDRALAGVWDDARRREVGQAIAATDVPYASATQQRIEQTLDVYAEEWLQMRVAACEATRTQTEAAGALLDLRTACLDDRLRELGALVEVLATADATVVEHAVSAARNLPPLPPCDDAEQLLSEIPQPTDPIVAAEVAGLRDALSRAHADALTGRFEAGAERCEPVVRRARELGYKPLLAEAAVQLGHLLEHGGKPEPAIASYEEALQAAIAGGHSRAEAEALIGLASLMSSHEQEPEHALQQLRHARAVIERLGDPPDLLARLRLNSGTAHLRLREFDEAESEYRGCIAAAGDRPASEQVRIAALSNLAVSWGERGRYREAAEAMVEAVQLAEAAVGELHPMVGQLYNNLGATHARMGNGPATLENQHKALAIYEALLGNEHPEIGRAHHNIGVGYSMMGEDERALASYQTALAIKRAALGPDDPSVAHSANNCGDALVRLGRPAEALPFIEEALRIWALQRGPSPDSAYALVSMAEARLALGEPRAAASVAREALAIGQQGGVDPIQLARGRFAAAMAIDAAGEGREQALELAALAREGFQSPERDSSTELARVDAWLAERTDGAH